MTARGALLGLLSLGLLSSSSADLTGRVVLPDDQPAAGARVVLFRAADGLTPLLPADPERVPGARVTTAGSDGGFVFTAFHGSDERGAPMLYARGADGRACFRQWWPSDQETVLRLTATRVEGRVLTVTGEPLPAGTRVRLISKPDRKHAFVWAGEVLVGAGGAFAIGGCDARPSVLLVVADEPPYTWQSAHLLYQGDFEPVAEQTTRADITLWARTVTGVVVTDAGRPVSGAVMELRGEHGTNTARTDAAGRFRIAHVEPGHHMLWLTNGWRCLRHLTVEVPADADPPPLRVERWSQAQRVRLLNAQGQPVRSRLFWSGIASSSVRGNGSVSTDTGGAFALDLDQVTGIYRTILVAPPLGYAFLELDTDVRPEAVHQVRVQPGGTITGRLVATDGRGVGGVVVRPDRAEQDALFEPWSCLFIGRPSFAPHAWPIVTTVSAEGTGEFTLRALPPGRYRLALEGDVLARPSEATAVVRHEGEQVRLGNLTVPVAAGSQSFSGTMLDRRRRPMRSQLVRIWLRGSPSTPREVTTDAQGHFRLWPVPPGAGAVAVDNGSGSWPWHKYEVKDQPVTGIVLWTGEPSPRKSEWD